jgi:DinB superfamily
MIENSLINTSIRNWNEQNKRLLSLLNTLNEDQLENQIAPGKNSGKYLLGHLAAINYNMMPLFGLGGNPLPELDDIFIKAPDKKVEHSYTVNALKEIVLQSIQKLNENIAGISEADWLDRHSNVSPEEFIHQPHRNKINVLISRTLHLAYHLGQLSLLK